MANKPVLNIEVNDSQFKAFNELFQQFQGKLGELPKEWERVNDSAAHSHDALAGAMGVLVESMVQSKDHARDLGLYLKQAVEAQKQFRLTTQHGANGLKAMTKHAKELKDTLFGAGKLMLKIGALGFGAVAGGLFGLDKLAQHAVANQRTARGLGLTTGQLRAFQTDFGARYLDEGALERANDARSDPAKRAMLKYGLGISDAEMDRMDVGELAAKVALKAHDWWVSTPEGQRNPYVYQASGLADAAPFESARFHGNTPRDELTRALAQYKEDAKGLDISNRDTDSLYSFSRQVELAGRNLETYFTRKLADLGPSLGSFITNLEKDAEFLLDGILTPSNMEAIKNGIDDFAKYLGSQEFRDSAQKFLESLGTLGKAIMKVARLIVPDEDDHSADYSTTDLYLNPERYHEEEVAPGVKVQVLNKPAGKGSPGRSAAAAGGKVPMEEAAAYFGGLEAKYRLPEGLIAATAANESSYNPRAISPKGAQGLMQLMPAVSKALGVADPFDWRQNAEGGAKLFGELQDRYKGDIRKEIAAWNWSPAGVDRAVEKYGANWEQAAPQETRNLIASILKTMADNKRNVAKVDLTITNKSGTAVAVSTNAGSM
jgi:hypothetical protein